VLGCTTAQGWRACMGACVNAKCAGVGPRRWPGAATQGVAAQRTKKRNKATTRARWSWQRHLQDKVSQPGSKAGITSGGGAVARCERRVPPRLEGRGVHRGQGKLVLTLVATGRSAGVGEEGRCGSSARRKKTTARRRGNRGSRRAQRMWVRLLPRAAPVFAATAFPRTTSNSSSPSSPSPPPLLLWRRCVQRRILP
jgi:hypothetical protein